MPERRRRKSFSSGRRDTHRHNGGALTLQNTSTASGQILIGAGATVETQEKGKNTPLVVGATIPKDENQPGHCRCRQPECGGSRSKESYSWVEPQAMKAVSVPVGANANAINKNVIFSGPAGSIVLGTGSTITADPPAPTPSVAAPAVAAAVPQSAPSMEWSVRIR